MSDIQQHSTTNNRHIISHGISQHWMKALRSGWNSRKQAVDQRDLFWCEECDRDATNSSDQIITFFSYRLKPWCLCVTSPCPNKSLWSIFDASLINHWLHTQHDDEDRNRRSYRTFWTDPEDDSFIKTPFPAPHLNSYDFFLRYCLLIHQHMGNIMWMWTISVPRVSDEDDATRKISWWVVHEKFTLRT